MKQLVTSLIDEIVSDQYVFLGSWCCKEFSDNLIDYKFDNRLLLSEKFKEFELLYEFFIIELSKKLNNIHKIEKPVIFWRILIGPWLSYFIFQVIEKYELINLLNSTEIFANTVTYNKALINNDLESFFQNYNNPNYESLIAGEIIDYLNIKNVKTSKATEVLTKKNNKSLLRDTLNTIIHFFFFWYDPQILIKDTYLNLKNELLLFLKLYKIPKLDVHSKSCPDFKFSIKFRNNNLGVYSDELTNLLSNLILKHIPKSFLEGYSDLESLYSKNWSNKPEVIFTSNAIWQNTIFAHYCATKKREGTKIIIGQHGGSFGLSNYLFDETHHYRVSDININWGWRDDAKSKPVGYFLKKSIDYRPTEKLLFILINNSRNSISSELFFNYDIYLKKQNSFLKMLDTHISSDVSIRIKQNDSSILDKINSLFENYRFSDLTTDFYSDLKTAKLVVATYNSTVFLQCIFLNIPVLMYIHLTDYSVRKSEQKLFDELIENHIVFFDNAKLACHINSIWGNVNSWWNNEKLQIVLSRFRSKMVKENISLLDNISDLIKNLN